ncbi:putative Ser/Thr phosphatase 2C [Giardia muris]|uniref:protein-serine/threonine phosphatase n=1 Tax=Giardia muris TaxID=5742 RepID=A0A4Z1T3V7_GIAMU|nr:putative Ser/Thr phosphatase 2C [Giardia muris]|eukprot:TNJ30328.1 putative Ser/Thr phosphatase 2C [Giardia muris]
MWDLWQYLVAGGLIIGLHVLAAVFLQYFSRAHVATEQARIHAKGLSICYGVYQDQGRRVTMEDAHTSIPDLLGEQGSVHVSVFAVFDGHSGPVAASFAAEQLPSCILDAWPDALARDELVSAFGKACRALDNRFLHSARKLNLFDGTTCICTALVDASTKQDYNLVAVTANIGDSRAILCREVEASTLLGAIKGLERRASYPTTSSDEGSWHPNTPRKVLKGYRTASHLIVPLSIDQKPHNPTEKQRIEASGGFVHPFVYIEEENLIIRGPHRIFPGGLAVSRALGDLPFKSLRSLEALGISAPLVVADPVVSYIRLQESDKFILQGCDGLWDTISSMEAVIFILITKLLLDISSMQVPELRRHRKRLRAALRRLAVPLINDAALAISESLCHHAKAKGSTDNISIGILFLHARDRPFYTFLDQYDVEALVSGLVFTMDTIHTFDDLISVFQGFVDIDGEKDGIFKSNIMFTDLCNADHTQIANNTLALWDQFTERQISMSDVRDSTVLTGILEFGKSQQLPKAQRSVKVPGA